MPEAILLGNRNVLAASVLMDELRRGGVADVCFAPGSRSAPLALAAAAAAGASQPAAPFRLHLHVDERCAAFFALGLARASARPVALFCSSGSAGAHFYPAILEAEASGIALVVITADRPPELIHCGAPQTLDQTGLFGRHVLQFDSIPVPRRDAAWLRWLRGRVCRALETAGGSAGRVAGPVHLNLAFDEPLSAADSEGAALAALAAAEPAAVWGRPDGAPWAPATAAGPAVLPPDEMQRLAERLRGGRGLVVAGPLGADEISPPSVLAFARACGAPLLADALSGLRGARLAGVPPRPAPSSPGLPSKEPSPILSAADLFLRDASLAQALRPDWILRLGRTPTSKAVQRWMAQHGEAPQFVVDSRGRREDPEHLGVRFLRAEPAPLLLGLARALAESPDPGGAWAASWQAAESAARAEVEAAVADGTAPPEAVLVRELADRLPAAARMLAASSMPVRELESFLAPASPARGCPDIAANRGLNGIDGLVSTLFGMAAARGPGAPVVGLLGDLAMLHDLGGLAAAPRLGLAPSFVVLNNGGGAIFEHLPVAATGAPMAELFVAEHSLAFEGAARMFGLDYRVSDEPREIALAASAPSSGRARLLELRVDRARSREAHQLLWRRASQASAAAARNVHPNPSTRCGGGSIGTCA